jgi:hypothetical protein
MPSVDVSKSGDLVRIILAPENRAKVPLVKPESGRAI